MSTGFLIFSYNAIVEVDVIVKCCLSVLCSNEYFTMHAFQVYVQLPLKLTLEGDNWLNRINDILVQEVENLDSSQLV